MVTTLFSRGIHYSSILRSHSNPLGLPKIPRMSQNLPVKSAIPGVKKILLVSSGKGGVGKSTISANLALSFQKLGLTAGLLDADIFGPSVPKLFNIDGEPRISDQGKLIPKTNYGLQTMSMGYLIPTEESAIAWRGMMVMKALQQLLFDVAWRNVDILVIDMPPGTGDTQLSIGQLLKVNGAVVVSTPQDLSLIDAKKGITMFRKMKIPILGLVENMSYFECPNCHHESHIFGNLGVQAEAKKQEVELLGFLPLVKEVREQSDLGKPVAVSNASSEVSLKFLEIAKKVASKL
ncbi:hypothetical protein DASC09_049000 [Saccharomycopsis crataegensis]|uniref:Uncharacterized protein n=1 Tax=Saccharomycopsis crataegensis TaxID=43959 RepID=A0AAV5QSL3_9ASCO|nr:hypothetical protein DASC09_049000 [Saccharomycopsis crataegensis]